MKLRGVSLLLSLAVLAAWLAPGQCVEDGPRRAPADSHPLWATPSDGAGSASASLHEARGGWRKWRLPPLPSCLGRFAGVWPFSPYGVSARSARPAEAHQPTATLVSLHSLLLV